MVNTANLSVDVSANTGKLEAGFKRAKDAVAGSAAAISDSIKGIGAATEQTIQLSSRELGNLKKALNAAETPAEKFAKKQEAYNRALAAGAINQAQYNKLIDAARKGTVDVTSVFSRAGSTALHLAGNMGQTTSTIGAAIAGMQRFGKVAGGILIGAATLRGYKAAADYAGTLKDTADSAGITAESLQELRYAGAQAGVGTEALDMAMQKLSINIGKAANGNKEAANAFAELGINVSAGRGQIKSTDAILAEIAKKIGSVESASQRAAIAVALFGKGGAGMARMLADGIDGLERMRQQAQRLGLVMSDDMVARADEAGDRMESLGGVLKIKVLETMLKLTPAIEFVSAAFVKLLDVVGNFAGDNLYSKNVQQLTDDLSKLREEELKLITTGKVEDEPILSFMPQEDAVAKRRAEIQAEKKLIEERRALIEKRNEPVAKANIIDADEIEKARKKLEDEGDSITKSMRGIGDEVANLDKLFKGGFINAETYAAKLAQIKESAGFTSDLQNYQVEIDKLNKDLKDGAINQDEFTRKKIALDSSLAGGAVGEAIKAQQEYNDAIAEANRLRMDGTVNEGQYATMVQEASDKLNEARGQATLFGKISSEIGDGFADAFGEIVTGAETASDAFRALGVQIVKSLFNQTIGKSIGTAITSGLGLLGFAEGGEPPVGKVSVVGEQGPELFVPKVAGTIIPNNQLGGSSSSGTTIYADMRGASVDAVKRLEAFAQQINASIEPRSVSAVVNANQRNPKLLRG